MGALSPWMLLAAAAAAVPVILHLFRRTDTRKVSFPALRYLQRTERERAHEIRLRQWLLLLLRVSVVLLVTLAGARLYLNAGRGAHPPTALALVVDNSLSSSRVEGDRRVLDRLKEVGRGSLLEATPEDRVWVIAAGAPWEPATPLTPADALRRLDALEPTDARGDLVAAVARARALVAHTDVAHAEVHLLSDGQGTAFRAAGYAPPPDDVEAAIPTLILSPGEGVRPNHALTGIQVGGGLAPLAGMGSEVVVEAWAEPPDTGTIPVRLLVQGRVRAAGRVRAGTAAALALPPAAGGWVWGVVETDPDALRADDRRAFAYHPRPAPPVALSAPAGPFVGGALDVLADAGRLRLVDPTAARILIAPEGVGVDAPSGTATSLLILPPDDPARLPALNRRLAAAGIGWRYGALRERGEAPLTRPARPPPLDRVRMARWFALRFAPGGGDASLPLAEADGEPWAVHGRDARGRRYLLLASPLDAASSTLPVSPAMVAFMEWFTAGWGAQDAAPAEVLAGEPLSAPAGATHVELPSGDTLELDATRELRATGDAGIYRFLGDGAVLRVVAVNPPPAESRLAPLPEAQLPDAIGGNARTVAPEDWAGAVFQVRRGPELTSLLLVFAVLALLIEARLAASGGARRPRVDAQTDGDIGGTQA